MSKAIVTYFIFPLCLIFARSETGGSTAAIQKQRSPHNQNVNGTLQKMIVENANVTMQFDLNGLNVSNSLVARPVTLQFAAAPNSFLPILVFNDLLRGLEPGSMNLVSAAGVNSPGYKALPAELTASLKRLALNKLPSGQGFELAMRDSNTGFRRDRRSRQWFRRRAWLHVTSAEVSRAPRPHHLTSERPGS